MGVAFPPSSRSLGLSPTIDWVGGADSRSLGERGWGGVGDVGAVGRGERRNARANAMTQARARSSGRRVVRCEYMSTSEGGQPDRWGVPAGVD